MKHMEVEFVDDVKEDSIEIFPQMRKVIRIKRVNRRFTREQLEQACQQMDAERYNDAGYAGWAAKKLAALTEMTFIPMRRHEQGTYSSTCWLYPVEYFLQLTLTQYDDWDTIINHLNKSGLGIQYNSGGGGLGFTTPRGKFDLTNDPDFADHQQKTYEVVIKYEDAHSSGW